MCIWEIKRIQSGRHTQAFPYWCSLRAEFPSRSFEKHETPASCVKSKWNCARSRPGDVSATQGRVDVRQSESSAVSHRPHPRGPRSKVIAEQPVVGLKKDYIYIRDRQLFWFGDGRYLHLMHNGLLHFQHKALEATKWIFDLGLSPRYTTERLEKLKTLFFFLTFFFNWGFVQHEGTEKHNNCI